PERHPRLRGPPAARRSPRLWPRGLSSRTHDFRKLAPPDRRRYSDFMPGRLLCALVLAGACSAPSAPTPAGEARVTDAPGCVAPAAETLGVPYQRPGDPRHQVDALTVWGWSPDGRTLAVETFDAGPGAATCEGAARLFVVEADSGTLVPGGYTEVRHKHPDPEPEPCDPPDLRDALAAQREAILQRHGIVVGHLLAPAEPVPLPGPSTAPAGVKAYAILLPTGRTATATLEVLDGDRERAFEARGSGLKLELSVPGK